MHNKSAIVIGAGIVGLAMARSLAEVGYNVTVFERSEKAVGASIRNFGMIWPIGQPNGHLYERALRSKSIWKKVSTEAGLWYNEVGSLHLAYNPLEWQVLQEFADANGDIRPVSALDSSEALKKSETVNPQNLKGAVWSKDEMIIEAREAMAVLPIYLKQKYAIAFYFNTTITRVEYPKVYSADNSWSADKVFICGGADFETLYPGVFNANSFTKCKLQMLRLVAQPNGWRIGPSLCGGLSLIHYKSFQVAPSISSLKRHYEKTMAEYLKWGIHVMVSQNSEGELTVGDSHEYALVHEPFDKSFINALILDYLKQLTTLKDSTTIQTWHGIYPKMMDGRTDFVHHPEEGVTIVNGLGGAGMTLSFGLAEEVVSSI